MKECEPLSHEEHLALLKQIEDDRNPIRKFLIKNWLGVLGIILAILGLISSYYFYTLSLSDREPVLVETNHFAIFASGGLSFDKFALIIKPEMKEVSKNVYIHEVAFWNNGRLPIKKRDILKTLKLKYPDGVEIIDAIITSSTRPDITNATQSHVRGTGEIALEFDILEKDDGFKLQVIYASNNKASLSIDGSIEGVSKFLTQEDLTSDNMWLGVGKTAIFALIFILFTAGFMYALFGLFWIFDRFIPSGVGTYLYFSFLSMLVAFLIYLSIVNFAKEEAKSSLPDMKSTIVR